MLLLFSLVLLSLCLNNCQSKGYEHGEVLYRNFCSNCHMDDGTGLIGVIPPLAGADYLAKHQDQLACIIRHGLEGEIVVNGKTYKEPMPGIKKLPEAEIANIINYINTAWGNDLPYMTYTQVQAQLKTCE
ncbi:MAG: cytochrome c [Bacteroidota bacterium]